MKNKKFLRGGYATHCCSARIMWNYNSSQRGKHSPHPHTHTIRTNIAGDAGRSDSQPY